MKIKSPRREGDYPDRHLDCEEAMEDVYIALIEWAEAAGWSRQEAIMASVNLAENVLMADAENRKTDAAIQVARRSKGLN